MRLHLPRPAVVFMVICLCQADAQTGPLVSTDFMQWRGKTVTSDPGQRVDVFLGVPYAAPPTGELRFKPPVTIQIAGEYDATSYKARCLERTIPEDPPTPKVPASEDCLYLDIYSPWSETDETRHPVMMYIHGGGFYGGSGALYNFTNVAAKGVVVVVINYRLDVFGWLSTGDYVLPGNLGLLDQAFALDWVKKHIRAFRGDPDDVTLFGGSAGAASISLLSLSPKTRGRFHKAIMASGSGQAAWAVSSDSPAKTLSVATKLGQAVSCNVTGSVALVQCLQGVQAEELLNTSVAMQAEGVEWLPRVDGNFLYDTPLNLLANRKWSMPSMMGYTRDDMAFYVPDSDNDGLTVPEFQLLVGMVVKAMYTENVHELVLKVAQEYLQKDPKEVDAKQLRSTAIDIFTDTLMVVPAVMEAKLLSRCGGQDSYLYEFAHRPSYSPFAPWQGVAHTAEKGFVLGLPQGPDPFFYQDVDEQDRAVADLVTTLWTNFAKFGDPTPSAVNGTVWQPYGSGQDCQTEGYAGQMYVIKDKPKVTPFDREEKVIFWTKTLPDFAKFTSSGDGANSADMVARPPLSGLFISLYVMLTYLINKFIA